MGLVMEAMRKIGVAFHRRRITNRHRAERLHMHLAVTTDKCNKAWEILALNVFG